MGEAYLNGKGVNKNIDSAIFWLEKAFESKDKLVSKSASGFLGLIYETGLGRASDFEKSVFYYTKAVSEGHYTSAFPLAYLYLQGHGTEVNYSKANDLFNISHKNGDKRATNWLIQNGEL